jgi:hypothetical protein
MLKEDRLQDSRQVFWFVKDARQDGIDFLIARLSKSSSGVTCRTFAAGNNGELWRLA